MQSAPISQQRGQTFATLSARESLAQGDRLRAGGGNAPSFPLRTREEAAAYIASPEGPTRLVVFEFSGAVLLPVLRQYRAMSVDKRAAEHGAPHYQGDVRDVIDLRMWDAVYFVGPNCFQHLRRDHCLQSKIDDGRAFWGAAMVLWCLCCVWTLALILEQPDTIVYDYIDIDELCGVEIVELRTSELGDTCVDKFVRLAGRNVVLQPPDRGGRKPLRPDKLPRRKSHWEFKNPDERDRQRSSMIDKPNLCEYIANVEVRDATAWPAPDFYTVIHSFSERWVASGHYLPPDFDNPTGQPLDPEEQQYQQVRGAGRGK